MPKLFQCHPELPQLFKQLILRSLHRYQHVLLSKWVLPPMLLPAQWLHRMLINYLHEMRSNSFLHSRQHLPLHLRYTYLRIVHWCARMCQCFWINWWNIAMYSLCNCLLSLSSHQQCLSLHLRFPCQWGLQYHLELHKPTIGSQWLNILPLLWYQPQLSASTWFFRNMHLQRQNGE